MNKKEFKERINDAANLITGDGISSRFVCNALSESGLSKLWFGEIFNKDSHDDWFGYPTNENIEVRLTYLAFYQVYMIEEGLMK